MRLDHLLSKEFLFSHCKDIPDDCQDQCPLVALKHPVEALANSFGYDSRRSVQSVRACHEQVADVSVLFSALRKRCLFHRPSGWCYGRLPLWRNTLRSSRAAHCFRSGLRLGYQIFENCIASTSINRTQLHQLSLTTVCLSVHLDLVFI